MAKEILGVLCSGRGTNLQSILAAVDSGQIPAPVGVVLTDKPDAKALERAEKAGISHFCVNRKQYADKQVFEEALVGKLREHGVTLVILAGFMRILSESFTSEWPNRILNVHPSLIPAFCGKGYYGLRVHEEALRRGVKVTGATVHFVNEIPDGGEILLQKAVDVLPGDTPEQLQRRVMEQAEWILLPQAAELVSKGVIA